MLCRLLFSTSVLFQLSLIHSTDFGLFIPIERCPNGFIFDGTGGTCSPADTTTCEPCPPAGDDEAILFTPVDGSCIDYNVCINGTLQETRNCSIGTRFNPTTKRCELTGSVKCQADVTCPPQEWIIPDPNTCDHFVLCQDEEVLEIKQCAPGLLFDRDLLECVVGTVCPYDTSIKIPLYDPSIPKAPVVFN